MFRNEIDSGGVNIYGYIEHFLFITDKMSAFVELWAEVQFCTQHSSLMLGKYKGNVQEFLWKYTTSCFTPWFRSWKSSCK